MVRELEIGRCSLHLQLGDLTKVEADAVVNAANSALRGGGGVDGAIHRAGGPRIMEECRRIGGCPTGEARITTGGNLPARHVIHAVGPVWAGGRSGEADLLASAYRNSLKLAEEHGLRTVAFASISTGVYGYPVREAARVALRSVIEHLKASEGTSSVEEVRFVLFSEDTLNAYESALEDLQMR